MYYLSLPVYRDTVNNMKSILNNDFILTAPGPYPGVRGPPPPQPVPPPGVRGGIPGKIL